MRDMVCGMYACDGYVCDDWKQETYGEAGQERSECEIVTDHGEQHYERCRSYPSKRV